MTVAANDRLDGPYLGNGVTTAFAYSFLISANTELRVILRDDDGVDAVQTLGTHYTVSGVGVEGGGNVTFVTAPATGEKVIIEGVTPKTQTVNYVENDRFPYVSHQGGMDKIGRQIQELQRDVDRALKFPHGETTYRMPLKPATASALGQNTDGEIVHLTAADLDADVLLGSNWATALGAALGSGNTTILAADSEDVTNITALRAKTWTGSSRPAYVRLNRNWTAGDGGGWFRLDTDDGSTADNSGTIIVDAAGNRWKRSLFDGILYPEFFGTSADWGAALQLAFTSISTAAGGIVALRPGVDYTVTTQCVCPVRSNVTFDTRGAILRPRYASGATFKFGTGASQIFELAILGGSNTIDPGSTSDGGPNQPVFEFRGIRSVRMTGIRGLNFYQIAKWGDVADSVLCNQWYFDGCDIGMRTNANGGHTHAIAGDGANNGLYFSNSQIEGDSNNIASVVNFINFTSALPGNFDHIELASGIIKGFDRIVSAVDARIVNVETGSSFRSDESRDYAFYFEATSGATRGGVESLNIHCKQGAGTGTIGGILRIKADKSNANIDFSNIKVNGVQVKEPLGPIINISTSGTGFVRAVEINGVHMADCKPTDANQDGIILDGDIRQAMVDDVLIDHSATASFTMRYGVYNNTATTKGVRIGPSITMDTYGTGVVYDPNVGDLSIGRFCALNPDGSMRRAHMIPFVGANFPASTTNGQMTIQHSSGLVSATIPAPRRGRVVEFGIQTTGTIAAGQITFGPFVSAAINTNLDAVFTSASGANAKAVVNYIAGSASLAEAADIEIRYTSDGSLSPTTIDAAAYVIFQEM